MNTKGQVMLITILTIGATILLATAIAGLLTTYQVRQANDLVSSAKSIFAADAGIESGLYQFFHSTGFSLTSFLNNAAVSITCYNDNDGSGNPGGPLVEFPCQHGSTTIITATGSSGRTSRALQFNLR